MSNELSEAESRKIVESYRRTGSIRAVAAMTGHVWRTVDKALKAAGMLPKGGIKGATKGATDHPLGSPVMPSAMQSDPMKPFEDVLTILRKRPMTLAEIAAKVGATERFSEGWLLAKKHEGLNIHEIAGRWSIEKDIHREPGDILEVVSDDGGNFVVGACGDAHLCSKYARLDVLNDLYDQYAAEGITHVFNAGNWIDGEARFNKFDLIVHGMDAQLRYLAENYPRRDGVHTYAIAGDDHEGWYAQNAGVDIGRAAERAMRDEGRDDWHDLGYMSAYVKLVNAKSGLFSMLHVLHPGGGSAYATSYAIQKIVESYSGGNKPAVLFAGHYHKSELLNCRNVWCVQTACTQDQTPFMAKKKLEAHVGGHIIRLKQDERTGAIIEMNGMKRYFDSGYYTNNRWSHSGPVNHRRLSLGGVD